MSRYVYSALSCIIISLCLLNIGEIQRRSFEATKIGLKILVKHLIDVQSYFEHEIIESKCSNDTCEAPDTNESEFKCIDHHYKIRIITRTPLIIYIENFLTENEMNHLIELANPFFAQSTLYDNDGKLIRDTYRTSYTASIERHETPIVQCIEQRIVDFQGNLDIEYLEPLQVVKYTSEQEFKPHNDWFSQPDLVKKGGQRVTTFFTYLYANCSHGKTEFLRISFDKSLHGQLCDILMCDEKSSKYGLRFRPIPGNSIFWFNVNEQGKGEELTYHAGRPPQKDGLKIGLNAWTFRNKVLVKKRQ